MKESVLHYLWKFKKLKSNRFLSVDNQELEILHPGTHNHYSGPDFLNAKVLINGIEWNGHVEIHVSSSEWEKHRHQHDPAYNNVILHVVYHCDQAVFTHSGTELIQAEIVNLIPKSDLENALTFMENTQPIPCLNQLNHVEPAIIQSQKERALFTRLERKFLLIEENLKRTRYDWEQVMYTQLARAYGTNVNQYAFERLAETLSLQILMKEGYSLQRTEAILFKASGLLEQETGLYARELSGIAAQFNVKYPMAMVEKEQWKFSSIRPHNFPTIRLAQFASMIHTRKHIFSSILETESHTEMENLFHSQASAFWDNHYTFSKASSEVGFKTTSKDFIHLLLINAVIPMLFAYGKYAKNEILTDRCIQLLEALPAEKNGITAAFSKAGVDNRSAFDSQSLIELKQGFCTQKKCLSCSIGIKLLNRS